MDTKVKEVERFRHRVKKHFRDDHWVVRGIAYSKVG